MVLDDPSLMTFDDLSSTMCKDENDDGMRMSIRTAWDKSAASGEDKIAAGGKRENNNI